MPMERVLDDPLLRQHFAGRDGFLLHWLGDDRRMVAYTCDSGKTMNVAGIHPSVESKDLVFSTKDPSFDGNTVKAKFVQSFENACPSLKRFIELVSPEGLKPWRSKQQRTKRLTLSQTKPRALRKRLRTRLRLLPFFHLAQLLQKSTNDCSSTNSSVTLVAASCRDFHASWVAMRRTCARKAKKSTRSSSLRRCMAMTSGMLPRKLCADTLAARDGLQPIEPYGFAYAPAIPRSDSPMDAASDSSKSQSHVAETYRISAQRSVRD
ncbi:hypothetical protein MRB53_040509 [Persea americana]|nr:hypothetical protein MRB53_040509 [Persea americana]